jgi:HSP20 family protein
MSQEKSKTTVRSAPAKAPEPETTFTPYVDIYEEEDGTTVLKAELPGAESDSLDIRVDKGVLTIQADGRVPALGDEYAPTYRGFVGGEFYRAFALSDEVDRDGIEADLSDGVLTLRLPRAAEAKTQKIEVKTG